MDRSGQAATGAGSIDWGTAGRLLRERARVTQALGEALEAMAVGSGLSAEAVADRLQEIVGRVLATGPAERAPAPARATGARGIGSKDGAAQPGAVLRGLQTVNLSAHPWPAVWFASAGTGADRVTLGVGVRGKGAKGVVGCGPEARVSSGWRSRPRPTCGRGG